MRLAGTVALIAGAARRMGRATAERFPREGARTALCDLDAEAGNAPEPNCRRRAQRRFLSAETVSAFGTLNLVVNSAGILLIGKDVPVAEIDEEVWDRAVAVKLKGTFLVCKYAIPKMIKAGGGSIGNVAPIAAFKDWNVTTAHCASKGGALILVKDIAHAYARHNIRANAFCPGDIETSMTVPLVEDPRWHSGIDATPMRRLGRTEGRISIAQRPDPSRFRYPPNFGV